MARTMVREVSIVLGPAESVPRLEVTEGPQTGVCFALATRARPYRLGFSAANDSAARRDRRWRRSSRVDVRGRRPDSPVERTGRIGSRKWRVARWGKGHSHTRPHRFCVAQCASSTPQRIYLRKLEAEQPDLVSRLVLQYTSRRAKAMGAARADDDRGGRIVVMLSLIALISFSVGEHRRISRPPAHTRSRGDLRPETPGVRGLHPHPAFGGRMDTLLVIALAERFAACGIFDAAFNFRGLGNAGGEATGAGLLRERRCCAAAAWLGEPRVQPVAVGCSGSARLMSSRAIAERLRPAALSGRVFPPLSLARTPLDCGSFAPRRGNTDALRPRRCRRLVELTASQNRQTNANGSGPKRSRAIISSAGQRPSAGHSTKSAVT